MYVTISEQKRHIVASFFLEQLHLMLLRDINVMDCCYIRDLKVPGFFPIKFWMLITQVNIEQYQNKFFFFFLKFLTHKLISCLKSIFSISAKFEWISLFRFILL